MNLITRYTPKELADVAKLLGVAAKLIDQRCTLDCTKCHYIHLCKDIITISDDVLKTRDKYAKDDTVPTSQEIAAYWEKMRSTKNQTHKAHNKRKDGTKC